MTSIGERAFEGCNNIESLTIPEGIKIIKKGTFSWCSSLESITIPSTIQYIYGEAFAYCTNIKEVIALPEVPPVLYENSFSNYDITLIVPEASIDVYMTTSPWSRFGNFLVLTDEGSRPSVIQKIKYSKISDKNYYDLNSRKVIPNQKGVYIHDGKKMIIRKY